MNSTERKQLLEGARQQAAAKGHALMKFKSARNSEKKHVAACHCGAMCIVYEDVPLIGNTKQVSGRAIEEDCIQRPRSGRWSNDPMDRCHLEADSPSYPPEVNEYRQCDCTACRQRLLKEGSSGT